MALTLPILASMITGPLVICVFRLEMNGAPISSGMGTCGLVSQIGVYTGLVSDVAFGVKANVVVNAPHTAVELAGEWSHPYSRMEAAFPLEWVRVSKFFPYVTKIDNGFGDRNLVCCNVD